MNYCKNCGKEFLGEGHCQDCRVAHLSLEVEKEKSAKKSLFRWFIAAVIILIALAWHVVTKIN